MKVPLEEGALVSGAGFFSLWSFVLGVLVLAIGTVNGGFMYVWSCVVVLATFSLTLSCV